MSLLYRDHKPIVVFYKNATIGAYPIVAFKNAAIAKFFFFLNCPIVAFYKHHYS